MTNPITEMKAEITTTKVLQRDLRDTLKAKQKAVHNFYSAKEKAETATLEPKPEPVKTVTPPPPKRIIHDEAKEQALLKMAKEHYQGYDDVAKFAQALELKPGVVYLTLKHHSFIQQNETTQYRVLDAYYKYNGNLKDITEKTGLKVWICAKTLEQLGLSPNWASYKERSKTGNLGDWAEEEFKKLVPSALDMNMQYQMNNPTFDFMVNGKTVDVKASVARKDRANAQYAFRLKRRENDELPDFFCFFLTKEGCDSPENGNYHILLVPKEVLSANRAQLSIVAKGSNANSTMYWDFEVAPAALAAMLEDI